MQGERSGEAAAVRKRTPDSQLSDVDKRPPDGYNQTGALAQKYWKDG